MKKKRRINKKGFASFMVKVCMAVAVLFAAYFILGNQTEVFGRTSTDLLCDEDFDRDGLVNNKVAQPDKCPCDHKDRNVTLYILATPPQPTGMTFYDRIKQTNPQAETFPKTVADNIKKYLDAPGSRVVLTGFGSNGEDVILDNTNPALSNAQGVFCRSGLGSGNTCTGDDFFRDFFSNDDRGNPRIQCPTDPKSKECRDNLIEYCKAQQSD